MKVEPKRSYRYEVFQPRKGDTMPYVWIFNDLEWGIRSFNSIQYENTRIVFVKES